MWHFSVFATDDLGFTQTAEIYVARPHVDAATVLPVSLKYEDQATLDLQRLYDGSNSSPHTIFKDRWVVFDFGQPVSFRKIRASFEGTARIEYETNGEWRYITGSSTRDDEFSMPRTVVAQRVKVVAGSNQLLLKEFRIGAGSMHAAP